MLEYPESAGQFCKLALQSLLSFFSLVLAMTDLAEGEVKVKPGTTCVAPACFVDGCVVREGEFTGPVNASSAGDGPTVASEVLSEMTKKRMQVEDRVFFGDAELD